MSISRARLVLPSLGLIALSVLLSGIPTDFLHAQSVPPAPSLVGTSLATAARSDSSAEDITLAELYARLARHSPRIAAARSLADAARARIPGARRPPDPQLQFGLMNYRLPALAPMDPIGMRQLQLMQMLPIAGKLSLSGRVADAQAVAAGARAQDVRWEQRARVAMAFFDLYQADRAVGVARETRQLLADIATTAQTMYAVGDGRQADVLRARVEIARMNEEIVRMETMRSAMTSRLRGLLDEPPDTTPMVPAPPQPPPDIPSLASLVAEAEANRPMVRAGEADLRAATSAERLARREIWTDLQLGVQYGQRGGPMGTERMGSLMIGASLPVFARDRQLQMRVEASAMRAMARSDLVAMRAETRARVAELYADIMRARALQALYRTTVLPQAQAAVTSSLASYRVGTVNLMTLLDNQMTVNRYRQELFVLESEQGKALAELEMLIGRELIDVHSRTPRDQE